MIGPRGNRWLSSGLTLLTLAIAAGLLIWRLGEPDAEIIAGALRVDGLSITIALMCVVAAAFVVPLQLRDVAAEEAGFGESHALLLGSVLGMLLLAEAQNLITFFIALELLSIPLYVLCGSHRLRGSSLESGLKYLIIASLGSATLLSGMASSTALGLDGLRLDRRRHRHRPRRRPADPDRDRALCGRARLQGLGRSPSTMDPRRLRGRTDPDNRVHGGATNAAAFAVFARFFSSPSARRSPSGNGARRARGDLDRRRQRRRASA